MGSAAAIGKGAGGWRRVGSHRLLPLVVAGVLFMLAYFAVNRHVASDPKLTLVVTQALLESGQIYLDAYEGDVLLDRPFAEYLGAELFQQADGHVVHYFPAGPAVLSLPLVAAARVLGMDMRTPDNYQVQALAAALCVVAVFYTLLALARLYLSPLPALIIVTVSTAGSMLLSTIGTALWALNFSTLFIALALWLIARREHGQALHPYLLGLLLFLAYFSRPTAAPFIAVALGYLLLTDRPVLRREADFLRVAGSAAALMALFLLWSLLTYGSLLPDYFSLSRLSSARAPMWLGVLGNLVSPSRGLLVYCPYLLPVLAGLVVGRRRLARQPLVWFCLIWIALHLALITRGVIWWGGASFGPRLLTDLFPAFVLLTVLVWQACAPHLSPTAHRLAVGSYLFLGALAVFIHAGQGLFNHATADWNLLTQPEPNRGPTLTRLGDMFSWQYAQPWASQEMVCALEQEKVRAYLPLDDTLAPVALGLPIDYRADGRLPVDIRAAPVVLDQRPREELQVYAQPVYLPLLTGPGNRAIFAGWAEATEGFRWSICREASVHFIGGELPREAGPLRLTVVAGALGPQDVHVALNGEVLGTLHWSRAPWDAPPETRSLSFDSRLLRAGELNVMTFTMPDAHRLPPDISPAGLQWDQRFLGMAFQELWWEVEGDEVMPGAGAPLPAYP